MKKTVSELLGHSSVTTTLKIYRGVNFDDKVNGIRTLEAIYRSQKELWRYRNVAEYDIRRHKNKVPKEK